MTDKSKAFEQLVARIESGLVPKGAVVRSPDHLIDKVTGQRREVDASVRYMLGSVPVLITVECRDRVKMEDTRWIEQLVQKQQDVGAAHTLAVSSSDFSQPALAKARHHGIETRVIREVSDEAIIAWFSGLEVSEVKTLMGLRRLRVECFDLKGETPTLDPEARIEFDRDPLNAKVFVNRTSGESRSLHDLLAESLPRNEHQPIRDGAQMTLPPKQIAILSDNPLTALTHDVPADGSEVCKTGGIEFDPGEMAIRTVDGLRDVRLLEIDLSMKSSMAAVPVGRVVRYSDAERKILDFAEREIELDGETRLIISQHKLPS